MRVLVVEDVRRLADDIAEGLRDQGIAADVAYDGLDAVGKLDINPYDVVVLDRDLPGLHGDVICRMIAEGDRPVMVLMLTASGTPGDRVVGLAAGRRRLLEQTVPFPRAGAQGPSTGQAKAHGAAPGPAAGRDRARPLRRTVIRDGRQIELSVKELALLEALMKASPAFLSPRISSSRYGTRTLTRSPRPCR